MGFVGCPSRKGPSATLIAGPQRRSTPAAHRMGRSDWVVLSGGLLDDVVATNDGHIIYGEARRSHVHCHVVVYPHEEGLQGRRREMTWSPLGRIALVVTCFPVCVSSPFA